MQINMLQLLTTLSEGGKKPKINNPDIDNYLHHFPRRQMSLFVNPAVSLPQATACHSL